MPIQEQKLVKASSALNIISKLIFDKIPAHQQLDYSDSLLKKFIDYYHLPKKTDWQTIINFINEQHPDKKVKASFFSPVLKKLYDEQLDSDNESSNSDIFDFFSKKFGLNIDLYQTTDLTIPQKKYVSSEEDSENYTTNILYDSEQKTFLFELSDSEDVTAYNNTEDMMDNIFENFPQYCLEPSTISRISEKFKNTLKQRINALENTAPDAIQDISNSNKQIFKEIVFDVLQAHGFQPGELKYELCFSGSIARRQSTMYSDIDAFIIIADEEKDKRRIIQSAMHDLYKITDTIHLELRQFCLDPIGISPAKFTGTAEQLAEDIINELVADPEIQFKAVLNAAPASGEAKLLDKLKQILLTDDKFKVIKNKNARAGYFYKQVEEFEELKSPKNQPFNIKLHVFRPLDMFITGLREQHVAHSDDGAHLDLNRVVTEAGNKRHISKALSEIISETLEIGTNIRQKLHNASGKEDDEVNLDDPNLPEDTKNNINKLLSNIDQIRAQAKKKANELSVSYLYDCWIKASMDYSFSTLKSRETKVIDQLFEEHKHSSFNSDILQQFKEAIDDWLQKEKNALISLSGRHHAVLTLKKSIEKRLYCSKDVIQNDNGPSNLILFLNMVSTMIKNSDENTMATGIRQMQNVFDRYNWCDKTADLGTAFTILDSLKDIAESRINYSENPSHFFSSLKKSEKTKEIYKTILSIDPFNLDSLNSNVEKIQKITDLATTQSTGHLLN